jgi:Fur family ferric uptake transcriptional regulator
MVPKKSLAAQLRASGRRLTPQRRLILSILDSTDDHLDADEVFARARQRDSRLNLATVYRTLGVLKEMDLVEQRYFARDHKREYYETVSKGEHYHFTCLGCREIIEVETPKILQAQEEITTLTGVQFTHACVCFEGYCADCALSEDALRRKHNGQS